MPIWHPIIMQLCINQPTKIQVEYIEFFKMKKVTNITFFQPISAIRAQSLFWIINLLASSPTHNPMQTPV